MCPKIGIPAPSLTQQSPNTIQGLLGLSPPTTCGNISVLRTDAVARELCSHLYETPPWGLALHVAPRTPNTETEAGEQRGLGLRTLATGRTHPHLWPRLPQSQLCPDRGSRDPATLARPAVVLQRPGPLALTSASC